MGFAKAAQAAGVAIERDTEVTGIRVESGRIVGVDTSRGRLDTPIVVNAAGPHARAIGRMAGVDVPVDPLPSPHLHRPGAGGISATGRSLRPASW